MSQNSGNPTQSDSRTEPSPNELLQRINHLAHEYFRNIYYGGPSDHHGRVVKAHLAGLLQALEFATAPSTTSTLVNSSEAASSEYANNEAASPGGPSVQQPTQATSNSESNYALPPMFHQDTMQFGSWADAEPLD